MNVAMVSLMGVLMAATMSSQQVMAKEVIIDDSTYEIAVNLNPDTVKCLIANYSASSFKIAVPQIRELAYLDHTAPGAPGPCINAGICVSKSGSPVFDGNDARFAIFHDPSRPTEQIQLRVIKMETAEVIGIQCVRQYREVISSTIRGVDFKHVASMPLASLPSSECR